MSPSPVAHGLAATWRPGLLRIESGEARAHYGLERNVGAVFGDISDAPAWRLLDVLQHADDPGSVAPDVPWFAVLQRGDSLMVACSPMLSSGIFWGRIGATANVGFGLVVATDPGAVVTRLEQPVKLSEDYVRNYARSRFPPALTPYVGVRRIPAGVTAKWRPGAATPEVHQWCGPANWGEPDLRGELAIEAYLSAFDATLAANTAGSNQVVTSVSGGLDSTFMAAGLARMATDRQQVLGLVQVPLPAAELEPVGGWDPDEAELAKLLEGRYPNRIHVRSVVNTEQVHPLDTALKASELSWVPTRNPSNQVWVSRFGRIAAEVGANQWFTGANGNASFSFQHRYAAEYYLRRGQPWVVLRLGQGGDQPWRRQFRTRVVGPLREQFSRGGELRRRWQPDWLPSAANELTRTAMDRGRYLEWLAGGDTNLRAAASPAAVSGILKVDPFRSRAVLDVAARITPFEWQRGSLPRGFARRAGQGRVPDEIRLRTRRGGQAWDSWYVIRNDRERYLDEAAALATTPALGGWVDHRQVIEALQAWPWGETQGPPRPEVVQVERLLGLAGFARMTTARLRRIGR